MTAKVPYCLSIILHPGRVRPGHRHANVMYRRGYYLKLKMVE